MDEKGLVAKRRNRSIATILSFKEKHCDNYLPNDISDDLRKVILDEINNLCELIFDILADDIAFNQEYLDMIEDLHRKIVLKD